MRHHPMEIFSTLLTLCEVNSPVTSEFPLTKASGALMFSLICTRTNGWVKNWDAGDLRCHGAHCDITVMLLLLASLLFHRYLLSFNNIDGSAQACSISSLLAMELLQSCHNLSKYSVYKASHWVCRCYLSYIFQSLYASAFRHRKHYVLHADVYWSPLELIRLATFRTD